MNDVQKKVLILVRAGIFVLLMFLLAVSFSRPFEEMAAGISGNTVIKITIYCIFVFILYLLLVLGPEYYFDPARSREGWLKDNILRFSLVLFLPFLFSVQAIYFFLQVMTKNWWIWGAVFSIVIIAGIRLLPRMAYSMFFHRQAVPDSLSNQFQEMAKEAGISLKKVYFRGTDEPVSEDNAVLLDFQGTVFFHPKLKEFSPEELDVLFFRELLRKKTSRLLRSTVRDAAFTTVAFLLLGLLFPVLTRAFGYELISNIASFPVMGLLAGLTAIILLPVRNALSRTEISREDEAVMLNASAEALVSVLMRFYDYPAPPPEYLKALVYSRPPASERLNRAREFSEEMFLKSKS